MILRQKFFYTVLGAVIMLIGMGVGTIISPPLIAQDSPENGVFNEIECRRLMVRDKAGNKAVALYAEALGNSVAIYNPGGKRGLILQTGKQRNGVTVRNEVGENRVRLFVSEELGNMVSINSPAGQGRISLIARESGTRATVYDDMGTRMFEFITSESGNSVTIRDKVGNVLWEAPTGEER